MQKEAIQAAEAEAMRFLNRIIALREAIAKYPKDSQEAHWSFLPVVEAGALRRASMDLTRALARMRRP
ncbi:MAG: hypothetical protein Q7J84_15090 [Sulfuricaulis sp.]|nr:hypothetical protein [Sulfuricaulis sp.]